MLDSGSLKRAIPYALIIFVCIVSYANSFDVPFVFDDIFYIVENPIIKNAASFTDPSQVEISSSINDVSHYFSTRYVGYLSFSMNYKLGGINVTGYHIVNLAIHALNALLVYGLLRLTFGTPRIKLSRFKKNETGVALLSALLFAAHPVHTQAVTYVTQRFTSLAAFFYLMSLFLYVRWRRSSPDMRGAFTTKRLFLYLGCLISAVMAMKTKETAFTLPMAVLLYEFTFFTGGKKRRLLYLVPFLLTMLIVPLSLIDIRMSLSAALSEATRAQIEISRETYLFTQFRVLLTYLRLLLLPVNQNLDYDYPLYDTFLAPPVFLSFLLLTLIVVTLVFSLVRFLKGSGTWTGIVAFGGFWSFVTLSVESSLIPLADVIFEHRLYLPSFGVFAATSAGAFALFDRLRSKSSQKALIAVMAFIPLMFSAMTYARNEVWRSDISLWKDVIEKSPRKARAYNNMGTVFSNRGLDDRAVTYYTKAIGLNPDYTEAYTNRGIIYGEFSQYRQALRDFDRALELNPNYVAAYMNRGVVFFLLADYNMAILDQDSALALEPDNAMAYYNRGLAYGMLKRYDEALQDYTTAIELNPKYADSYNNRGVVYMSVFGEEAKACEDWKRACELGVCENYNEARGRGICE